VSRELPTGRISTSIRRHVAMSAEGNPDGPIAMYVWLWHSIGRRPGPTFVPRPIRFCCMASLDLISVGGWYVRTRVFSPARSLVSSGRGLPRMVRVGVLALAVALGLAPPLPASGQDLDDQAVIGSWQGLLGGQLTVIFTVELGEDGDLTGTLESPDQSDMTFLFSSVKFEDGTLTLAVSSVPGTPTFSGELSADGSVISGEFSQGTTQLPLELTKTE